MYLLGVVVLDTRGKRGVATAAVLPGVIALVAAVIFFGNLANSTIVAGALSVAAGLLCGSVGAQSHRRFMLWTGALLATVGALFFAGRITQASTSGGNSHTASVFGAFAILFGVVMIVVAMLVGRLLGEPAAAQQQPSGGTAGPSYARGPDAPAVTGASRAGARSRSMTASTATAARMQIAGSADAR